jgi:pimeloyl-ACP methyl ester carboxylesterase
MERARNDDVIVDPDDALFDDENIRLGMWDSARFLNRYGAALFLTEPYDPGRTPVILIHGINGSPRNFARLASRLASTRYQPVAFFYPTGMPLAAASRELGARLEEFLDRHPTTRFAIVGHSMGGLVAKGLLDEFDVARAFPAWRVFVGISCPWSGVAAAGYSRRLRTHPASWDDLASTSTFVRRINTTPFPKQVAFYLFWGGRERGRLLSVFGNNDGRLSVDSMVDTPLAGQARDTFGFYEDHVSIVDSARVFDRLETVLDSEFGRAGRRR